MLNDLNHFHVHCARQLPFMGLSILWATRLPSAIAFDTFEEPVTRSPPRRISCGWFEGKAIHDEVAGRNDRGALPGFADTDGWHIDAAGAAHASGTPSRSNDDRGHNERR
jgi:hypothetical protein